MRVEMVINLASVAESWPNQMIAVGGQAKWMML